MVSVDYRKIAAEIFNAGLEAVDPYNAVNSHTERIRTVYRNGKFKRFFAVGFGKAACPMAKALIDSSKDIIDAGVLITKYGHCDLIIPDMKVIEAGHPVPDENGMKGADEIIELVRDAGEDALIVCLISGGGSALLASPLEGITLDEKQKMTQLLLRAGADINELNCVRKHISKVKGGRLAEIAYPARVISLILSDVIGDKLDVIASGPTSPDKTSYHDARRILEKYRLTDSSPRSVLDIFEKGIRGLIPDTPKEQGKIFKGVENIIIGSNKIAIDAAKQKAEEMCFRSEVLSSELTGEARDVAQWLAEEARKRESAEGQKNAKGLCLISGGETTVTVKGSGLGGRNTEFALAFAKAIDGRKGITLLSAGTDGTDGPTDAAGAVVDGYTVQRARAAGIDPEAYLDNNDSYNFFKKTDGLIITGPTGTNVMDLQVLLLH